MAVVTQVAVSGVNAPVVLTRTAASASDSIAYASGTGQKLVMYNTTASPIVATIVGSTATTISPTGLGGTVSVASGLAITVAADGTKVVDLDKISAYLAGVVTITGGTGLDYHLYA